MKIPKPLTLLFLLGACSPAAGAEIPEYNLKAAYLYNLGKFVTWPAGAFSGPQAPMVIGVLGTDPFGGVLDGMVQGKTLRDRPIQVSRFGAFGRGTAENLRRCHILFISRSERSRIGEIVRSLKGSSVLTVSEEGPFLQMGGDVLFIRKENRLSLRINRKAAMASGLEVGAKLLSIFEIYEP